MLKSKTTKIGAGYKPTSEFAKNHNQLGATTGMFTPHDKKIKWEHRPKFIYRVNHADGTESQFKCFYTLDHVDLRTWVTLLAAANAKHHATLATVHDLPAVVERLELEGEQLFDKAIEFTSTVHQLLVDAGVDPSSTTSRRTLKESLTRLSSVTWFHTDDVAETSGNLIAVSFANSVEKSGAVSITLNPKLTQLLMVPNAAHTSLQMSEVRSLKTACDYILHYYLCALTRQNVVRRIKLDTMVSAVWDVDIPNLKPNILSRHRCSVKTSLKKFETLGWVVSMVRDCVYEITRPSDAKVIFENLIHT